MGVCIFPQYIYMLPQQKIRHWWCLWQFFEYMSLVYLNLFLKCNCRQVSQNLNFETNVINWENFRFQAKQSEAKFKSIFSLFSLFLHFFSLFFAFFRFKFFASLWFSNFCFQAKQSEVKFTSIFSLFSLFFTFFFFAFFRLIFVSLRVFRLIFAYFTFVFASDFWCLASKWIMWNQAFFSLPSETKFSLQFQISLPKRKWGRTLVLSTENREGWRLVSIDPYG